MKSVLITSSILILLIAALRPLLRGRIDPRVQYALWLIAALRLLVPVEWAVSSYSALALLDRAEEPARVVEAIGQIPIPAQSYSSAHEQALQEYEKQLESGELVPHISQAEIVNNRTSELMRGPTLSQLAAKYARPVWLGGAVLMGLWFLLVNLRLRRKLKQALPVEVDCPLPVYVSLDLPSPCLHGALRPAVYVTPAALADPDRLRHILAHELTHYRHRDHWWALARCLCLCLYWFDPLVWWAAAMSRQDCELACDAGAIRRLGEAERIPYGRTLVAMIASGRNSLLQTATTMTGGKRRVTERVRLIARKPKTVIALALAAAIVLGLAVGCTFTGAPEESQDPNPLSSDELNTATLPSRLMDIPGELHPNVDAASVADPSILVDYRLNVPAEWVDGQAPRVLAVERVSRTQYDAHGFPEANDTDSHDIFAKDNTYYYSIVRTIRWQDGLEDEELFTTVYQSIREFAIKTVLETEGVEAYDPGTALSADPLQARLLAVPEEWRDKVSASPATDGAADCLATYWLNDPKWADLWSGYLLTVYRLDEAGVQQNLDNGLWPAVDIFARGGGEYYALVWPADRYQGDPAESKEYWDAVNAMTDYVKQTVLASDGVEPFDPYTTPPHFFSNVKVPPLDPGTYAINGMDYTLVTSYKDVPEDPDQWYLTGYLRDAPVWMFTRNSGAETMFQVDGHLTQIFSYRACYYGGGQTHDGKAPQLMPLEGFAWGPKGTSGPFAVITHLFQGGTDQQYQLTVYDLEGAPINTVAYVHDWKPLMEDFNQNHTIQVDPDTRTVSVSYEGQTVDYQFDANDELWTSALEDGVEPRTEEYSMTYVFNDDGTADLIMPIMGPPYETACWTLRFTGSGFETVGFHFGDSEDYWAPLH